jgi:hypothetical protein
MYAGFIGAGSSSGMTIDATTASDGTIRRSDRTGGVGGGRSVPGRDMS